MPVFMGRGESTYKALFNVAKVDYSLLWTSEKQRLKYMEMLRNQYEKKKRL